MSRYTYTFKATDFTGQPFPGAVPRARVRPVRDASGPDGNLSARDIPVALSAAQTGSVELVATVDTTPQTNYILILDWMTTTQDGQEISGWGSEWEFTAVAGGGDIRTMGGVPASAQFYGPPWPANTPPGAYFDIETGDVGWKEAR